jgi:hypothetical protein
MSNDAGNFTLLLKEGQSEIQISYIGYIDTLIIIEPDVSVYNISLKPYEYELTEVIVKPLSPLEYIKAALKKHPTISPNDAFETRAFFASKLSGVNAKEDGHRLQQAVFKTYNTNFANDTLKEPSQLLLYREDIKEGFTSILTENKRFKKIADKTKEEEANKTDAEKAEEGEDNIDFNINGMSNSGPESVIKEAKSITQLDFFNPEYYKKFKYTFGEQTYYQGRELIKIDFSNKRKVEGTFFNGSVYLDFNDLAIVAVDYNERYKVPFLANAVLKTILGVTINAVERDVRVRNQKLEDKWYPKEVVFDLTLTIKQKKLYEDLSIAQILNVEEVVINDPTPIAEEHIFDRELEYPEQVHSIEGVTWEGINVIEFDN